MIKKERLLALDVMRGITIAAMIMVNNPASSGMAYAPLQHMPWNGITPTDLIYPFFIFIMGISTYFSLNRFSDGLTFASFMKIAKRSVVIFAIGLLLLEIGYFGTGTANYLLGIADPEASFLSVVFPLERFRIMGVLQGLAIAYFFGAIIALIARWKHLLWIAASILVGYFVLLQLGNGYELSETNIIAIIDRVILGENHLYMERLADGTRIAFEPEAILSSLPRIAQVLLGIFIGKLITTYHDNYQRINKIFIFATITLFAGLLLQYGDPLNKKIWSTSFTLVTTGFGSLLLALLIWIIDIKKRSGWSRAFESFGVNPLFLYVVAWVFSVMLSANFRWGEEILSVKKALYTQLLQPILGNQFGSLVYSLALISVIWLLGYILYRKKIYIKI